MHPSGGHGPPGGRAAGRGRTTGRLGRLKECKARLEAEDVKAKYEAELARRGEIEAETGRRPVGRPPKLRKPTKNSLVANPTDPDSRVMKRQYTYLQGYNAQAVVNEDHIVLAAALTQESVDLHQLHPMLHEARANLASAQISKSIDVALADSGYYSEANLEAAEAEGPELLMAVAKSQAEACSGDPVDGSCRTSLRPNEGEGSTPREPTRLSRCSATSRMAAGSNGSPGGAWAHAKPNGSWFAPLTNSSSCGGVPGPAHRAPEPFDLDHPKPEALRATSLRIKRVSFRDSLFRVLGEPVYEQNAVVGEHWRMSLAKLSQPSLGRRKPRAPTSGLAEEFGQVAVPVHALLPGVLAIGLDVLDPEALVDLGCHLLNLKVVTFVRPRVERLA